MLVVDPDGVVKKGKGKGCEGGKRPSIYMFTINRLRPTILLAGNQDTAHVIIGQSNQRSKRRD